MATVNITRDTNGKIVLDPNPLKLGKGDFVVWSNHDPKAAHWPTLQGKAADWWMNDSLPAFEHGQPAATSPAINLAGTTPITYVCSIHPDHTEEQGTIEFAPTT